MIDIKDRPGCITKAEMRVLFEKAITSSPAFANNTPLGIVTVNGEFAYFGDPDTDTMWLGFALGMRCAERLQKAIPSVQGSGS